MNTAICVTLSQEKYLENLKLLNALSKCGLLYGHELDSGKKEENSELGVMFVFVVLLL